MPFIEITEEIRDEITEELAEMLKDPELRKEHDRFQNECAERRKRMYTLAEKKGVSLGNETYGNVDLENLGKLQAIIRAEEEAKAKGSVKYTVSPAHIAVKQ
jgi:hypothetical protein